MTDPITVDDALNGGFGEGPRPQPAKPETDMEMVNRTRKRLDEFVAHLDEGGKFSVENVLELIAGAQDLGNRLELRSHHALKDDGK